MTFEIILAEDKRPPVSIPALMAFMAFWGLAMYVFGRADQKYKITRKFKDDLR